MRLATLRRGGRDGTLVVVDRSLRRAATVPKIARTLQDALDDWVAVRSGLADVYDRLNAGGIDTSFAFRPADALAPLPRTYRRLDALPGALRLTHGSSGAYQATSRPLGLGRPGGALDVEVRAGGLVDTVPRGVGAEDAVEHVALLVLVADVRVHASEAASAWLADGHRASTLAPVAVTPDDLGDAWQDLVSRAPITCEVDGRPLDDAGPRGGHAHTLPALVSRAAEARPLEAGTLVCTDPVTSRLTAQRLVHVEAQDATGRSVYGAIDLDLVAET